MRFLIFSLLIILSLSQTNDDACRSLNGTCTETCNLSNNDFISGKCAGGVNRRCCIPKATSTNADEACRSLGGICTESCDGSNNDFLSGKCAGAASRRCCVPKARGLIRYGPAGPLHSSSNSCRSPISSYSGVCISVSDCSGANFNGLCPGNSKCCVPSQETTTYNPETVPKSLFLAIFSSLKAGPRADAMYPFMISAMAEANISGCFCTSAFMAQVSHESGGLLYFEEIADGSAYEGRRDLGNTQPGDGRRFKGRGPIQLTGRANYEAAGKALGLNLTANPEMVGFPGVGWRTTAWFWNKNGLNNFCRSGSYNDFVTLTKRINGGVNGLDDRVNKWRAARAKLGCQ